ncbi:MAG: DNA polymerase III subunit delta [Clostridia bacterium]|nr:DNA polymerase III subunit delta [Clostridia bacterium]
MTWNEFYQALKAGQIAPVYLFTGPEAFIKREALEALRKQLLPPGLETLNDATLEGVTAQQITDACETMPMMCDRRIVTVRDWAPLMPGKAKNEEAEAAWMQSWLENPPQSCALVFYMRGEMDGRKKLSALLKKRAEVVNFEYLTDSELNRWCARRLKPVGKRISPAALNTLTYMAGRELTRIAGELDKLAAYLGDERDEITEADVRAIVPASLEYNVFELLNSLLAGDMKKGQQTVNSLLQGGQTTMGILAMLTRQIRQLTHMKCALDAGTPVQTVQTQLKLHPYAAKQTARQCARLSADRLTALYKNCVDSDYAVKSGRLRDRDALDALIFEIGLAAKPAR